jgi:CubicO group peptidase (beta-lactamase class C family)
MASYVVDRRDYGAVDRYVQAKMHSARIPGAAVAIVKGDQVVYMKGFGVADPSRRPVTPQTPFLIGSITKPVTALAIMQLVEAGQVALDAPVQRYLPWFRVANTDASARITVRELLTMTSGLPQSYETQLWTGDDDRALERVVRHLSTAKLTGTPGHTFAYANANFETLGMIVQAVSGESYEEFVQHHIFAPLDMRNSFVSQIEAREHGMASGYRWWFGTPVAVTMPYHRAELPAGYIIASTEDMTHFLIAEMNEGRYGHASVLSPATMALSHTEPPPHAYGFGWEFLRENGRTLINHDGGTTNFQASLFFDPTARVGVYVAANVINALDAFASPSGSSPLDGQTTRAMARVILSLATQQPLPDVRPGHERLTQIFDVVIAALTAALAIWLARLVVWERWLRQHRLTSWPALLRRHGAALAAGIAFPVMLVYLLLEVPVCRVVAQFQPDLAWWLGLVSALVFAKAVLELVVARRVMKQLRGGSAAGAARSRPR